MSFTYTISSQDRVNNIEGFDNHYEIDFGGFGSHTGRYRCTVKRFTLNGNLNEELGYVLLTVDNLHVDGYYSARPSYEMTLCACDTTTLLTVTHGASFIVNNCQTKKRVIFRLKDSTHTPLNLDYDINIDDYETNWLLMLELTPID